MGFIDWISSYRIGKKEIFDLGLEYPDLETERDAYKMKFTTCTQKLEDAQLRIQQISRHLKGNVIQEAMAEYLKKYPAAIITHRGRSRPFSDKYIYFPVNCLITPYDPYIIQDLIRWGLFQTGEDPETLIPKIYYKIKKEYYKYTEDRPTWGVEEVWELPFEMRAAGLAEKKGFDCDSWANFQLSYYVAAGVPAVMARGVAGDTMLGGHATVYVYSPETDKFHHLNSTYGMNAMGKKKVSEFPTHDDAREGKDNIGITKVWFSYDLFRCYYQFKKSKVIDEIKDFEVKKLSSKQNKYMS